MPSRNDDIKTVFSGRTASADIRTGGLWQHLDGVDAEAASSAAHSCESLLGRQLVRTNGFSVEVDVSAEMLWDVLIPLALRWLPADGDVRRVCGVAGPPGSGKTTFAELLVTTIHYIVGRPVAVAVGMDGFHFPNHYLQTHFLEGGIPLSEKKGSPPSFDVLQLLETLESVRQRTSMRLPEYDRVRHDPIPDQITISNKHRLILVEGNYLLHESGEWGKVRTKLNECLYMQLPADVARNRLLRRHVAGGRTHSEAELQIESVDEPNRRLIEMGRDRASFILTLNGTSPEWLFPANPDQGLP